MAAVLTATLPARTSRLWTSHQRRGMIMTMQSLGATEGVLAGGMSIFDPASPNASRIVDLSILTLCIAGAIFLIVEGVLLYAIWRFRLRDDQPDGEPPQVYGSMPVEVAWTAAPTMVVFFLVLVTAHALGSDAGPTVFRCRRSDALRHRHWSPVVVGVRLRNIRRQDARIRHGQRTAHSRQRRSRRPVRRFCASSRPTSVTVTGCPGSTERWT